MYDYNQIIFMSGATIFASMFPREQCKAFVYLIILLSIQSFFVCDGVSSVLLL